MLRLQSLLSESNAHGPSLRSVLWLAGTNYPSPLEDLNPFVLHFEDHHPTQVSEILNLVFGSWKTEGVSIFASDCKEQAEGLTKVCDGFQKRGLGVFLYSPKPLEEMKADPICQNLLLLSDVYIAGAHIPELAGDFLWRTSSNQVIHFISNRYKPWQKVFCSDPNEDQKQFQLGPESLKNQLKRMRIDSNFSFNS